MTYRVDPCNETVKQVDKGPQNTGAGGWRTNKTLETELDKTVQQIRTTEHWSRRMENNDKMLETELEPELELEDGEQ